MDKETGEQLKAWLTSDPLLAIANRNFKISDTTTDSLAWDTRGASRQNVGWAELKIRRHNVVIYLLPTMIDDQLVDHYYKILIFEMVGKDLYLKRN